LPRNSNNPRVSLSIDKTRKKANLAALRYVLKNTRFEFSEATEEDVEDFLDVVKTWECDLDIVEQLT
jgi:hypothetical protein